MKKSSPTKADSPALPAGADPLSLFNKLAPITYLPIGQLSSYARKLRKHDEKQLTKLMASIRAFSFNVPLLVTPAGEIIVGEARLEAARRLGMTQVPAICIDHLTPAQIRPTVLPTTASPSLRNGMPRSSGPRSRRSSPSTRG